MFRNPMSQFAAVIVLVLAQSLSVAEEAQNPPPAPALAKQDIEQLPGVYKVTSHGGLVCDSFLVLTPEPVLIDCGSRPGWDQLVGNHKLLGLTPADVKWVIGTHGHWDHVDSMARFQSEYPNVKFALHAGDAQAVIANDRVFSCAEPLYKGVASDPIKVDRILFDGDTLEVGKVTFRIVHTPGHTPGSITVLAEVAGKKVGFCGDSVTGFYALTNRSGVIDWENSVKKLMALEIDQIYAGHRKKPVVGKEEIAAYLKRSLDATGYKRKQQAQDETYQDLVYAMENNK